MFDQQPLKRFSMPSTTPAPLADHPQSPPRTARRLSFTRKQLIGLPLLLTVPILTLLGVFGERSTRVSARSKALTIAAQYPERFRYRQVQSLQVSVTNITSRVLDTVHVSLDTAYISRFSSVRIEPAPHDAFAIDLRAVKPGESRLISAELWGERYGRHRGCILASTGSDTARLEVSTLVFP